MDRREFLGFAAKGTVTAAAGASLLAACSSSGSTDTNAAAQDSSLPTLNWKMGTSWPESLDTIYGGAKVFAARVKALTGGKFNIEVHPGGDLFPALEVLDNVQQGNVEMGHTASYYYIGKSNALAFGTAVPFGFTYRQQNAWLYQGGGLELMQNLYKDKFNAIQFPAGNTGVQMGGWFNKEITSANDLKGLKMRIPGLGGKVMDRLGVTVQVIAGGEIFQALQTGTVDAAEWVGPYDDQKLGFDQVAKYYYFPGWWEPGPTLEVQINLDKWNSLPPVYQEIIKDAAHDANETMMATYDVLNPKALKDILAPGKVQLKQFPDDVMQAAQDAAFSMYDEFAAADPDFKSIYDQWTTFRKEIEPWHADAEYATLRWQAKALGMNV